MVATAKLPRRIMGKISGLVRSDFWLTNYIDSSMQGSFLKSSAYIAQAFNLKLVRICFKFWDITLLQRMFQTIPSCSLAPNVTTNWKRKKWSYSKWHFAIKTTIGQYASDGVPIKLQWAVSKYVTILILLYKRNRKLCL